MMNSGTYKYNGDTGNSDNRNSKKWYQKTAWIIILLILFFPIGLYLMWRYTNWKKPAKIIISAFFAFIVYAFVTAPDLESVKLQADTSTVYDINEQIDIGKEVKPDSYSLSSGTFKTTGGEVKSSGDKVFFTSDKAGTFEVYVDTSGIKSNTLTFQIEDKAAIAKEKADKEAKKLAKEKAAAKKAKEDKIAEEKKQAELEAKAQKKAEEERLAAEAEAQKKAEQEAAAKKAEEDRIATEAAAQAEQERIAAEQAQQQTEAQQPQEDMVWISATGSKYHSYSSCGNMNPDNAYQMSQSEAEASGYGRCMKCH